MPANLARSRSLQQFPGVLVSLSGPVSSTNLDPDEAFFVRYRHVLYHDFQVSSTAFQWNGMLKIELHVTEAFRLSRYMEISREERSPWPTKASKRADSKTMLGMKTGWKIRRCSFTHAELIFKNSFSSFITC
nr:hypothetical protein CFP56_11053 [Quercus suber]